MARMLETFHAELFCSELEGNHVYICVMYPYLKN